MLYMSVLSSVQAHISLVGLGKLGLSLNFPHCLLFSKPIISSLRHAREIVSRQCKPHLSMYVSIYTFHQRLTIIDTHDIILGHYHPPHV